MALLDRLMGTGTDKKIPVHQFWAAMKEVHLGVITVAQVKTFFNMSAEDQTDFDWLIGEYQSQPSAEAKANFIELMHSLFLLAETGSPGYTTNTELVARIQAI